MLEWLTSTTSIAILASAAVFYLFGRYTGAKTGARVATDFTIDSLAQQGYVKYTRLDNGDIEIHKINEE